MGNGFDVPDILSKYKKIAVVGGGIGTAPMYQLTRELAAGGVKPDVFFGFRDKPYCMEEYRSIANSVKVSTDTGAVGFHGFVTHGHDAERRPPLRGEGHPLLRQSGKEDGLRHRCLPRLHLRDQERRGQERVQEWPCV